MKKLLFLSFAVLTLSACKSEDPYKDEPFIREEFSVDGERYVWEDMGHEIKDLFEDYIEPDSFGDAVSVRSIDDSTRIASFSLHTEKIDYQLINYTSFFFEGRRYEVIKDTLHYTASQILSPVAAKVVGGWFSLSHKPVQPIDRYVLTFEFDCVTESGDTVRVRDGLLEVCRRFNAGYSKFIIIDEPE